MKKVAIFASGNGSNFQALAEASLRKELNADICLLVCDQPEAYVVKRARHLGIPVFSFRAKEYPSKEAFENEIALELAKRGVEWIILAGYMRLIGSTLLNRYRNRIVNIHPSLLPAFPGKDAIGQALDAGVKVTGVTIHFVDEGMDTGPIIAQQSVNILAEDTRETLQKKIQAVEHELYPKTINELLDE
ncbi:phosphoribosylglycinamide formyltransferase [Bacillus smithii]|uniref:Phosphoribosylglycinamide formyltransferase n=1 Tax=Bacillus smithii 7_3_47FAA TaxID=665952 RepID=G9QL54_9BACI|nr:phosphoribosylglycinamide formyltransferase [Bacillus smithii]EHL78119.1 phosphoribosylglycinamide formyltransferase [Bacillus smithii 7_3_47FAA]